MTRTTMDDGSWRAEGGHPDEGTLHAWLDSALAPDEAQALEAHVDGCEACQASVAEARGLIAGASRIVRELDPAPAATVARAAQAPATTPTASGSMWRLMRVTPTRAAIAAGLIVALGITLTRDRAADPRLDTTTAGRAGSMTVASAPVAAPAPASAPASAPAAAPGQPPASSENATGAGAAASDAVASKAAPAEVGRRMATVRPGADSGVLASAAPVAPDSTLQKAIARRIAADQPPRTMEAAPAANAPMVPARSAQPGQVADASAGMRVAAGREAARAAAESAAPAADRARAQSAALSFAARGVAACYRLERASPPAVPWNGGALPMTITLTEIPTELRTDATSGAASGAARAITLPGDDRVVGGWTRRAGDTLSVELRGSSLTTTGVLGPTTGTSSARLRAGSLTASPAGGGQATTVRVVARPVPCAR